jgi:hypothetical protein
VKDGLGINQSDIVLIENHTSQGITLVESSEYEIGAMGIQIASCEVNLLQMVGLLD